MGQVNLLSIITSGEDEIYGVAQLVELLGSRCRRETKDKLYKRLCAPRRLPTAGIFARVHLVDDSDGKKVWRYCAGRSYTDEIKVVRQIILDG